MAKKPDHSHRYAINFEEENAIKADKMRKARAKLMTIHSALDRALGDMDITHLTESELREDYPVQWAAQKLMGVIEGLR